jgi:ribose 5-phosphate isomerase B
MRVAVGTDHRGYALRARIIDLLQRLGHEVDDLGTYSAEAVDYPDIAARVARKVAHGEAQRGILICGTGLGMCITANKFPGVRAAPCHDDLTAELSRRHNDSNILCLSADLLGERLVDRMVELWLTTPFEGGRHARRVDKIAALEREISEEHRGGGQ